MKLNKNVFAVFAAAVCTSMMVTAAAAADGDLEDYEIYDAPIQIGISTDYMSEWCEERFQNYCSYDYQTVCVGVDSREAYPKLTEAFDLISSKIEDETTADYEEELAYSKEQMDAHEEATHSLERNLYVRRSDERAVSLLESVYAYRGGAHGSGMYNTWNIDPMTGDILKLSDICTDPQIMMDELKNAMTEKYPEIIADEAFADVYDASHIDDLHWTLEYDGIGIYFGHYEAAAYAAGMQNVKITFVDHEGLFDETYLQVPDSYSVAMTDDTDDEVDVDGDGSEETIRIVKQLDEYGYGYDSFEVFVDDNSAKVDGFFFNSNAYILKDAGRTFLYYFAVSENDYSSLYMLELTSGTPEVLRVMQASLVVEIDDSWTWTSREQLTDPKNFGLSIRTDLLSTISGTRRFFVNELGYPQSIGVGDWYDLVYPIELTLKKDLLVTIVNEKGQEQGEETLAAGTVLSMIRSNGIGYSDFKLEDDRYARVYVVSDQWPRTVNGEEIEELFDGMQFAG